MSFTTIWQVRDAVRECTDCHLCRYRTKAVAGRGEAAARAILIGEAPGRNEDSSGEPFVGEAGRRLSIALKYAEIDEGMVYITNVVKCRPPGNRVPTPEEISTCKKYLDAEIAVIRPRVICVMGNTAYGTLLGGKDITRHHGKVIRRGGQVYLLTIHPASTIYRPRLMDMLKEDMTTLAAIIGERV